MDDNEDIHRDFRRILGPGTDTSELDSLEASLFGEAPAARRDVFEITSAHQGAEALEKLRRASEDGAPYALAFVDVRMPPGLDGIETLSRMWQADAALQAVICSAHSDYSWDDLYACFGQTDRLLVLKKPFDPIEVRQIACALTEKWNQHRRIAEATHTMRAQYTVTQVLVESTTLDEAGPRLLEALGQAFEQPLGALWLTEDDGRRLRCACVWSAAPEELAAVAADIARARPEVGEGGLGRAALEGEPRFTADAGKDGDPHLARAPEAGLRAALHFPIKSGDVVLGVIELLARSAMPPDGGLTLAMGESCAKIARFIEAKRAESALRKSEAKHRGLLNALPDTLLRISGDGTCLDFKASRDVAPSLQPRFSPGSPIAGALPDAVVQRMMLAIGQAALERATQILDYEQQVGGELRHFEARIAAAEEEETLVILRDVTEQRRAVTAVEQRRAQEETIRAQAEALEALSTPLIPITDDIVVMPLVGRMDPPRMRQVQAALVTGIAGRRTRIALLDLTGVPSVSPDIAGEILNVARAARLLGAELVLTGLQPAVAMTLASLDHDLTGVATHLTLQSGVASAMSRR